jgi:hypothetical protein
MASLGTCTDGPSWTLFARDEKGGLKMAGAVIFGRTGGGNTEANIGDAGKNLFQKVQYFQKNF